MEDEINSRQRRGQELYRQGKYADALMCFTSIVDEFNDYPIGVLDNRAAAYSRLGDLPKALKDGKRMIEMKKSDHTGYLRTGQILQKQKRSDLALKIYAYGLRNVDVDGEGSKLLRSVHEKLSSHSALSTAADPLLVLPVELIDMVLCYLDYNNIISLLRVSKSWNRVLQSTHTPWIHLDFSRARKWVPPKSLKDCVRRGKGMITRATVFRVSHKSLQVMEHIINRCPKLEYLEVRDGLYHDSLLRVAPVARSLTTLVLGTHHATTLDLVSQLLRKCPCLLDAEFRAISHQSGQIAKWEGDLVQLRTLVLCKKDPHLFLGDLDLQELVPKLTRLKKFAAYGWAAVHFDTSAFWNFADLEDLQLSGIRPADELALPSRIRTLRLAASSFVPRPNTNIFNPAWLDVGGLQLKTLALDRTPGATVSFIDDLLCKNNEALESFSYHGSSDIGGEIGDLSELFVKGYFANIRTLELSDPELKDEDLHIIADNCPRLLSVDLRACIRISGVGIKMLMSKDGDKITRFDLCQCSGVGRDAIDWLIGAGVRVIHGNVETKQRRWGS